MRIVRRVCPLFITHALVIHLLGCETDAAAPGVSGLINVVEEPAGPNCASGGLRVEAGLDTNGNGRLDPGEVADTHYVCHGAAGSDGPRGEPGQSGSDGVASLIDVREVTAGSACAMGGQEVRVGLDQDGDGQLDDEEVLGTYHLCHGETGAPGSDGLQALVAVADQVGDTPCPHGGKLVTVGLDHNGNHVLDADEVTSTEHLCHGAPGEGGQAGGQSLLNLIEIAEDPCPDGGTRIEGGLDLDANGQLDPGEVARVAYVCHGADGEPGHDGHGALIDVTDDGDECSHGGKKIRVGIDRNDNQVLDDDEVTATEYVCNGAAAAGGAGTLVDIGAVYPGDTCAAGGSTIRYGRDRNEDTILGDDEVDGLATICSASCGAYVCGGDCGTCSDQGDTCVAGGCFCGPGPACSGYDICVGGACVRGPEPLATQGPISSLYFSNTRVTEDGGQAFQFTAQGVASPVETTTLRVAFDAGTVTWESFNVTRDYFGVPRVQNPSQPTGSGSLIAGQGSTIPLARGDNLIVLTHTEAGQDEIYTIKFRRGGQLELLDFSPGNVTMTPSTFSPSVHEYTLSDVPYAQSKVEFFVADTFNRDLHLQCDRCDWWLFEGRNTSPWREHWGPMALSLNTGDNRATFYYDPGVPGVPVEVYRVNVRRLPAFTDATLSSVTFSNTDFSERGGAVGLFDARGLPGDVESTSITTVFTAGTVTWKAFDVTTDYHGQPRADNPNVPTGSGNLISGQAAVVPLVRGDNTIVLTHVLDSVESTYTFNVRRGGQLELLDFSPANVAMTPAIFDPNVREYTLSDVPYSQAKVEFFVADTFNRDGHLQCDRCDWWLFEIRNTSPWREHWGPMAMSLSTGDNRATFFYNTGVPGEPTVQYHVNVRRLPAFSDATISSVSFSNTDFSERSGTVGIFDARGVAGDVETTNVTAVFTSGTVSWKAFNVTVDYQGQPRAQDPDEPTGVGVLTSGQAASVPLARGDNRIVLTHVSGSVETVYTFNLRRAGRLERLEFIDDHVVMSPDFRPDVFVYDLGHVPYATTALHFEVADTYNRDGVLQCDRCDWWLFELRNTSPWREHWGPMRASLNVGQNRITFSYNPGVEGVPTTHYIVNVSRGEQP